MRFVVLLNSYKVRQVSILQSHVLKAETAQLAAHGLTLANCADINIFLSSMDLFARVNAVYANYFGSSPPARACVAVDLPDNLRVKLDAIAFIERSPNERQALHVQGLSYWAPANIGPYSQAIVVRHQLLSVEWRQYLFH